MHEFKDLPDTLLSHPGVKRISRSLEHESNALDDVLRAIGIDPFLFRNADGSIQGMHTVDAVKKAIQKVPQLDSQPVVGKEPIGWIVRRKGEKGRGPFWPPYQTYSGAKRWISGQEEEWEIRPFFLGEMECLIR